MIKKNGLILRPYKGLYGPVNIYEGSVKKAGWHNVTQSEETITIENTYNDVCDVEVGGNTVQSSDYYTKDGLSTQTGTPTPDAPIPIVSNLPAGTYKYTSNDGIYEFTLNDDLRGLDTSVDKVIFDRVSHRGILEKRCGRILLDNTLNWTLSSRYINNYIGFYVYFQGSRLPINTVILCDKFDQIPAIGNCESESCMELQGSITIGILKSRLQSIDVIGFKAWLASNPVDHIYIRITPTTQSITFTKVTSSEAPEVPMTFFTNAPSLSYPADVNSVTGNLKSTDNDAQEFLCVLPELRKIGSVFDSYNPATGEHVKRVSDWVTLDGSLNWINITQSNSFYKKFYSEYFSGTCDSRLSSVFNFETVQVLNNNYNSPLVEGYTVTGLTTRYYATIPNVKTGFNIEPTNNEIKAYFYGWKMCNADGTSPYYKSEVPYTPETWAEWSKMSGSVSILNNEATITFNGTTGADCGISKSATVKPTTKYGYLFNVVNRSVDAPLTLSTSGTFNWSAITISSTGNKKAVLTSIASPPNIFYLYNKGALGSVVTVKNIQIFELPTGSQIESDFNTLTADQLSAKYTFNGLCPKNWKKITDGTGQTATLPTASYTGYTPYKMIYQLAEPITTWLTPVPIPSFYPTTVLTTDGPVKGQLTATLKVEDSYE